MNALSDLYSKANNFYKMGDYEKAVELYTSIIEKYPDTEEASYAKINLNLANEAKASDSTTGRNPLSLANLVVAFLAFFIWFALALLEENKISINLINPEYQMYALWLVVFIGFCYANRKLTPDSPARYVNIFILSFILTIGWFIVSFIIMLLMGGGFDF